MVTPAGVNTIFGFDFLQNFFQLIWIGNSVIFVIENVSGNTDNIRIFPIDFIYNSFGLSSSNAVTEMCVSEENYL